MNTSFTIDDPLDGHAVTIIITLPASEEPKDQRQAMVSIGVPNEMPVIKTGTFGTLDDLLHEAWKAFGVQAEAAKAAAKAKEDAAAEKAKKKEAETAVSPQLLAEAPTEAEAAETPEAEPEAAPPAPAPKPKPAPAAPKPWPRWQIY